MAESIKVIVLSKKGCQFLGENRGDTAELTYGDE